MVVYSIHNSACELATSRDLKSIRHNLCTVLRIKYFACKSTSG